MTIDESGGVLTNDLPAIIRLASALVAWSMATTDQRQAELAAAQLELPA